MNTRDGSIEVGITIDPDGAVTNVLVTRATVEVKPWILDVEDGTARLSRRIDLDAHEGDDC
jgi:hypothetical protein